MTQAPTYDDGYVPEARTSALAIMSLVFGLVCLLPGPGLIAVVLGIAALLLIDRSRGRLRGTGLGVGGIVLGFLASLVWAGIFIGAAQLNQMFGKSFMKPLAGAFTAIEAGDYKAARGILDPKAASTVTDEQFAAFCGAYQADVGNFVSTPDSLWRMGMAYAEIGPLMQNFQSGNTSRNLMPVPATFQNGMAVILIEIPRNPGQAPPAGTWVPHLLDMGVLGPSGTEIWLIGGGAPAPAPAAPPTPPAAGEGAGEGEGEGDGGPR